VRLSPQHHPWNICHVTKNPQHQPSRLNLANQIDSRHILSVDSWLGASNADLTEPTSPISLAVDSGAGGSRFAFIPRQDAHKPWLEEHISKRDSLRICVQLIAIL